MAALAANSGNLSLTAHEIGVPLTTLKGWANAVDRAAPADLRQEKRADLSDLFRAELEAVFEAMKVKRGEASYANLSTAAGIYADKLMALTDTMPTQRVDARGLAEADQRAARILTMVKPAGDTVAEAKSGKRKAG